MDCDIKELQEKNKRLEAHVAQLQNIISKMQTEQSAVKQRKEKPQRPFDFSKSNTRHVALKIAYLGQDFHGFAVQEETEKTIEHELFKALHKTRLIESRETSNYHRCGRTDKGVSAFSQVISLDLRSNQSEGLGVKVKESATPAKAGARELCYVHMLNKVLPAEIRVLAWSPVAEDFSARFSCRQRTYKYYFPRADLDINKMREAARKLVGEFDFRNLCKMDVGNGVVNFTRVIMSATITPVNAQECVSENVAKSSERSTDKNRGANTDKNSSNQAAVDSNEVRHEENCDITTNVDCDASEEVKPMSSTQAQTSEKSSGDGTDNPDPNHHIDSKDQGNEKGDQPETLLYGSDPSSDPYTMYVLRVTGQAFLWHQIRCIVAVLLLIGRGKESPVLIDQLLDVETNPRKPQYTMASELPLVLYDCDFPDDVNWIYEEEEVVDVMTTLQASWAVTSVKAAMLADMLADLERTTSAKVTEQVTCLLPGNNPRKYRPIMSRDKCESLEARISHYVKRKRITLEGSSYKKTKKSSEESGESGEKLEDHSSKQMNIEKEGKASAITIEAEQSTKDDTV